MKNNFITKIIGATLAFAMMIGGAVGINAAKQAKEVNADDITNNVSLANGTFSTDHITWNLNDAVSITQTKGSASTAVNSNYISEPRVYKGHILSFVAAQDYAIKSISIGVNGNYYGNSMTAGIAISGSTVTNNTAAVSRNWTTTSDGTHTVSSTSSSGLSAIYVQNVASESNVQLRIKSLSITYCSTSGGETPSKTSTTTEITAYENKTTLDLALSPADTVQLSAAVTHENGSINNPSITWESSKTNIATVSQTGLVTAVGRGKTTITAAYAGDETYDVSFDEIEINVINSAEAVFDFAAIAAANSWVSGTAYTPVVVDGVTITANGGGNNAKYYSSDDTWRIYNGGSVIITPPSGKSIVSVTCNPSHTFTIASGGTSASSSFTAQKNFKSIIVELDDEKILDSITASVTNTSRVWRTNDIVAASDLTVVPHFTDGTDGTPITDGTGVTVTNGTLQIVGSNTVNVSYGGKSTTVTVNALSSSIVEWTITGEIGETVKSTAYNLSGLTLHGWYDNGKTDEASSSVVSAYGLVANPAVAGSTPDENNTIEVKVYANSDTGHTNCLKTFENVAAPIIIAARGSEQNPYTVAQAIAAIDAGTGVNGVYVTGIVSEIVDPYSSQYHNISYNISADGLTTSVQLEAFRGKSFNGANFTSADDIEVGAVVVVYGNLIKYGSTYELAQDNRLVSYVAPVRTLESIALSGTYPTEFLTGDVFSADGMIVTATYDNGSQRIVTDDVTFTGYDMSEAGQQAVTVSYEEGGVTKTATYDITVTFVDRITYNAYNGSPVTEGDYILFYDGNAVKNSITSKRADYQSVTQNNGTILSELDTIVWHIASNGEYYTIYNAAANKYLASTGSKNEAALIDDVTDNALWSIEVSGDANKTYDFANKARAAGANNGNKYLRLNDGFGFACYASGTGGALSLFKKDAMRYLDLFETEAKLVASETDGNIDSVSIKFTTKIAKYAWDAIVSDYGISEFGMMGYRTRKASPLTVEEKFEAEQDKNNLTTLLAVNADTYGLTLDEEDGYYSFTVKVNISGPSSYDLKFIMAPYIVVNGTHHFLDNLDPSVNYLAQHGLVESQLSQEALETLSGGQGE